MMDRFWRFVDRSGGPDACWPWMAGCSSKGYGSFRVNGRQVGSHRVALGINLGRPLGPGEQAHHTCDNPPCCNPGHLVPGDHAENMADKVERGRQPRGDGHVFRQHPELHAHGDRTAARLYPGLFAGTRNGRARLSEVDIPVIRERRAAGESCSSIARDYGVNLTTIHRAGSGQSWTHVQPARPAA